MADAVPQGRQVVEESPDHESDAINIRPLLVFVAAITLFLTMIYFLLAAVMNGFVARENATLADRPARYQDERGQFPPPQLQPAPAQDLRVLRAEEQKK